MAFIPVLITRTSSAFPSLSLLLLLLLLSFSSLWHPSSADDAVISNAASTPLRRRTTMSHQQQQESAALPARSDGVAAIIVDDPSGAIGSTNKRTGKKVFASGNDAAGDANRHKTLSKRRDPDEDGLMDVGGSSPAVGSKQYLPHQLQQFVVGDPSQYLLDEEDELEAEDPAALSKNKQSKYSNGGGNPTPSSSFVSFGSPPASSNSNNRRPSSAPMSKEQQRLMLSRQRQKEEEQEPAAAASSSAKKQQQHQQKSQISASQRKTARPTSNNNGGKNKGPSQNDGSDNRADASSTTTALASSTGKVAGSSLLETGKRIWSAVSPHTVALRDHEQRDRNDTARLFGLNYNYPQDALTVGLQFTIPFLNIPLGSIFSAFGGGKRLGSILSVNKSALVVAGLVALAAIVLFPLLLSYVSGLTGLNFPFVNAFSNLFGRREGSNGLVSDEEQLGILGQVNEALRKHSIDSQTCVKRFVCTYVKSSREQVEQGKGESKDLLIDGLASNFLVKKLLGGTSLEEAIAHARDGGDCDRAYSFKRCPLNQNSLYTGLLNFVESDMDF